MAKNLFQFSNKEARGAGKMQTGAAPKLEHLGAVEGALGNNSTTSTAINVVESFPWTNSPKASLSMKNIPHIDLVEHDILANPMLNQLANNLSVAGNLIPEELKVEIEKSTSQALDADPGAYNGAGAGLWQSIKSATRAATEGTGGVTTTTPGDSLFPYDNMYTTKPTGWRYVLPYYTDNLKTVENTFSTDSGQTGSGIGSGLLDTGMELTEAAAGLGKAPNITQPGSYIEQSKFYGFQGREKSHRFKFPLSNTVIDTECETAERTISRNWQLLFLLVYQNTPNRMTRDLILPPAIYEAHVPGVWYSKYAYISSLTVDFVGTRRLMDVTVPVLGGGDHVISTIIPDVYEITIGVTELVAESQNMLYHLTKGSSVITTG